MPITFMLKPEGFEFWRLATASQEAALQAFCTDNKLRYEHFSVPSGFIMGTVNRAGNLYGKPYKPFKTANGSKNVFTYSVGQRVDTTNVFIEDMGETMLACPFDARYVDPCSYEARRIPAALRLPASRPPSHASAATARHPKSFGCAGSAPQGGVPCAHSQSPAANRFAVDMFDLHRFLQRTPNDFKEAVKEIQAGKKKNHWIYYYVPTPPYIKNGQESGSRENRRMALRDYPDAQDGLLAAKAFVENETLKKRLLDMYTAIHEQLCTGNSAENLLGSDKHKLLDSVLFFHEALNGIEKHQDVVRLCAGIVHIIMQSPGAAKFMLAMERRNQH